MRLIDAIKLSDAFDEEGADVYAESDRESAWGFSYSLVHDLIARAPEVDTVPVVRCKDCVHWDDDPDTYGADDGPKGKCMKSFETMCADDFCSYGERKENNHEKV